MADTYENEPTPPSTTWAWVPVKIRRPAGGQETAPKGRSRFWSRPKRDPRQTLTLSIKYRGGPGCWYEVHARGCVARYPGIVALHDVMTDINRTG